MEIVAESSVILVHPSGEREPVSIRIGKPYRVNDHEWACPVKAPALQIGNHDLRGSDSFHALMVAQGFLRQTMQMKVESGLTFMDPEDGSVVDVPFLFGSSASARRRSPRPRGFKPPTEVPQGPVQP